MLTVLAFVGVLAVPVGFGTAASNVAHVGTARSAAAGPKPLGTGLPISLLGNVALANGTFRNGNASGPNGFTPTSLAYDGIQHRLFVGVAGPSPGVIVIDPTSGDEVARWTIPGGSAAVPRALAFDSLNDLLDVAGGSSGNVSFLDPVTGAVENSTYLGVGTDPVALAVDEVGKVLAVTEASDASVALLNASSGALRQVVTVGSTPDAVAYDPVAGRFIVANGGGSTVTLLEPTNGTTAGTESVGNAPDGVTYDSVQGHVLVANRLSDNVTILATGTLVPSGQYGTGRGPGLLSCTIDGQAVIPNALDHNVTVVDDSTGGLLPSQATGIDPLAAVWDPSVGRDYIVNAGTDNLTVLNLTVTGVEGSSVLGGRPMGIADLPTLGRFALADAGTSAVVELSAYNLSEGFRATVPSPPVAVAFDEALGRLFAIEPQGVSTAGNLSILDATSGAILGTYPVGKDPQGVAFDPVTGQVYVANWGSATVSAVDPLNGQINATFPIPAGTAHPSAISVAVSSNGSELFVPAGTSNDSVTVLNASTGAWIASVLTPGDPQGVADDPSNGTVWVADTGAREVTEIVEATDQAVANFTLGVATESVAVDDPLQWVVVTAPNSGIVDVLNASDGTILAVVPVGAAPTGVAIDPATEHLAVTDPTGGDVALVGPAPPGYPVTFQETGLPDPLAGWTVTVDGTPVTATSPNLTVVEPNGTHFFGVTAPPGYFPTPSSGSFEIAGQPDYLAIAFGPPRYNATFFENGLGTGTSWTVVIDGQNASSASTEIVVPLPNGTFAYRAFTASAYAPIGGTGAGNLTVQGSPPVPELIRFAPIAPYWLNFTENGLPAGTLWTVDLGASAVSGNGTTLRFRVGFGPYAYTVPAAGGYVARPPNGEVTVTSSTTPPVAIQFFPSGGVLYPVTFEGLGLPSGTSFSVLLNNTSAAGSGAVNFSEPNGTLPFTVEAPPGWSADPEDGSLLIAGAPVVRIISFHVTETSTAGLPVSEEVAIALVLVAVALVVVALLVLRHRRPPRVYRVTGELVRSGGGRGAPAPPPSTDGPGTPTVVEVAGDPPSPWGPP